MVYVFIFIVVINLATCGTSSGAEVLGRLVAMAIFAILYVLHLYSKKD